MSNTLDVFDVPSDLTRHHALWYGKRVSPAMLGEPLIYRRFRRISDMSSKGSLGR